MTAWPRWIKTRSRSATTDSPLGADSDWRASLKGFGHDLLNRQINLIVTTGGMVGSSVPPSRQALKQIATTYAKRQKMENEQAIKALLAAPPSKNLTPSDELKLYQAAFNKLKQNSEPDREQLRANLAGSSPAEAGAAANDRVELRIADHTAVIANLLEGLTSSLKDLTPRQIATIQKIWEIGTDTIVMQTTISLGGDVVTRIHSDYTDTTAESLWHLHQQSVDASSSSWKNVVDAAVQLFQGLFGKL